MAENINFELFSTNTLPEHKWTRKLSEPDPDSHIHTFSRPPILEALSLLPVAARVGSYIWNERRNKREPIFDLNGIMLEPPKPGPYAGCPLGGIGGGCIGRGYRGDFRRWSLFPGKYSHETIHTNQFCVRVKSSNGIYSKVLSIFDGRDAGLLSTWNWGVPREQVTYHSVFPRAWTVITQPITGIDVIISQLSPIFPHSYMECSLPCCIFEVTVTNTSSDDLECSVMFVWENSDGQKRENIDPLEKNTGYFHKSFVISSETGDSTPLVKGVCQSHHHITRTRSSTEENDHSPSNISEETRANRTSSPSSDSSENKAQWNPFQCSNDSNPAERIFLDQGSFSIASMLDTQDPSQEITVCEKFSICEIQSDLHSPDEIWERFHETGTLPLQPSSANGPMQDNFTTRTPRECRVGSAICSSRRLPANQTKTFSFSLAWDNPIVRFGEGRGYTRFYSRIFGSSGMASPAIASYALLQKDSWRKRIVDWQSEVQADQSLPSYYRSQLFNELYYLVDGGTLWIDLPFHSSQRPGLAEFKNLPVSHSTAHSHSSSHSSPMGISSTQFQESLSLICQGTNLFSVIHEACSTMDERIRVGQGNPQEVGRFLYLEGHEYLMYNTYDVHFYAGFALLMCWPQLELSLQRDIASSVSLQDPTLRMMLGEGHSRPRKVDGAVPHDVGSPSEDPLHKTNIYNFQDVSLWKDLGPKFILQVYRDYLFTQTPWFLVDLYPVLLQVMKKTLEFDQDGDGMIENQGFPDQTYDIWTATGVHAYCGGLWIASCYATSAMAKIMNDNENEAKYYSLAERAKQVYDTALWNGVYFNYDSSSSAHHDSIMADMLAGQWYAFVCDLPRIVSREKSLSALQTIFRNNVQLFSPDQPSGAVNGMKPNGTIDMTCLQSREVWTGTTYALAATMIHEYFETQPCPCPSSSSLTPPDGINSTNTALNPLSSQEDFNLLDIAFQTAEGIHNAGWRRYGYWFATPEAWEQSGNYRSLGYMRPLAIWAMQYALLRQKRVDDCHKTGEK